MDIKTMINVCGIIVMIIAITLFICDKIEERKYIDTLFSLKNLNEGDKIMFSHQSSVWGSYFPVEGRIIKICTNKKGDYSGKLVIRLFDVTIGGKSSIIIDVSQIIE